MKLFGWKLTWQFHNGLKVDGQTGIDRWSWGATGCTDEIPGRDTYKVYTPVGLIVLDGAINPGTREICVVAGPFLVVIAEREA